MTPDALRAEAEKVAASAVTTEMLMRMGKAAYRHGYNFDMQRELQGKITDAILAFSQRHAEHVGEVERLRGQIEVMEVAVGFDVLRKKAQAELAALEKGEGI